MTVEIPPELTYHGEATGRPVVYVEDVPEIVARHLDQMSARYPADVFTDCEQTPDGIAGTVLRTALAAEAAWLRGDMFRGDT